MKSHPSDEIYFVTNYAWWLLGLPLLAVVGFAFLAALHLLFWPDIAYPVCFVSLCLALTIAFVRASFTVTRSKIIFKQGLLSLSIPLSDITQVEIGDWKDLRQGRMIYYQTRVLGFRRSGERSILIDSSVGKTTHYFLWTKESEKMYEAIRSVLPMDMSGATSTE